MAQIASGNVTYTHVDGTANPADPAPTRTVIIAFGDGSLTYTNGGIPLDKTKLGCPTALQQLIMMDAGNTVGYVPKWNMTANTIRLYQDANITAAAAAALTEVLTSAAVTATTLRCIIKGY